MNKQSDITPEILSAHKEAGINFVWLTDSDGNNIVARNTKKEQYNEKIKEIKKRIPLLNPGVYFLNGLTTNNTKRIKPLQFSIIVGNLAESQPVPGATIKPTESVNVLSYSEALKRAEEISKLTIENESLRNQVKELEEANDELAEELEELKGKIKEEEKPTLLSQANGLLNQIIPILSPLADEYFKLQNKKLDLLSERNKITPRTRRAPVPTRPDTWRPHPEQNSEEFQQYLKQLDALPEEQFDAELMFIESNYPELYSVVCEIFYSNEETEGEQ